MMYCRSLRSGAQRLAACWLASLGVVASVASADDAPKPAAMPALAAPPAGRYQLDKTHASVELRVNHLGFSTYTTRFRRVEADLSFDPVRPATSQVTATIDAASLDLDAWPSQCLDIVRGAQLLDIERYPAIVFRSERVQMTGAKTMDLIGTLTLRGVARPIVLAATYNGGYAGIPNMDPHARIGFSARGSFKRSDFGMGFGVPAPGTTMGVGDQVDFSIEAEFTGPALAPTVPATGH